MIDIEKILKGYSISERAIRRLTLDLIKAKSDYDCASDTSTIHHDIYVKTGRVSKPTEAAAIAAEAHGNIVRRIQRDIAAEQANIDSIDHLIQISGLDPDEREYINLRYLKGFSVERVEKEIGLTHSNRIKNRALCKIECAWRRISTVEKQEETK